MEKHYIVALSDRSPTRPPQKPFITIRRGIAPFALAVTTTLLSFVLLNSLFTSDGLDYTHSHIPSHDDNTTAGTSGHNLTPITFKWSKVIPSPDLKWHACGERRECARLELPMDHLDPGGEKVAVALVRIPATHKEYRGPILVNPGGPGKSGISFTHAMGEILQNIVGPEYDIMGFDQRGIGATTPKILNFPNDIERALWRARDLPVINISNLPDVLPLVYSRADVYGQLAFQAPSRHAAEYVGSVATARDMVNITNAFGFDKVKYWGFSSGATVGGTIAAMFPDRVGRIILDGVMNFSDYYSGRWLTNLEDMDKIISYIFEACVAAGPENCPLYESTPYKVGRRFDSIFDSIVQNPVAVFEDSPSTGSGNLNYAVIDYASAKLVFFDALNRPFSGQVELLFDALAALEKGDGKPMMHMLIRAPPPKCEGRSQSDVMPTDLLDGAFAIRCGDSPLVDSSIEEVAEYLRELGKTSVFADIFSQIRVGCSGWRIRAKERYEGGFNKTTSHPLLVIANKLDPVTPWAGSKKVSEDFPGSAFLTVDGPGASSPNAGMSPAAIKHIRNYFRDGTLPPDGTVCPVESKIFVKNDPQTGLYDRALNGEEREIWELAREFVRRMGEATSLDAMNGLFL